METRGALILMTGRCPGYAGEPARARFGSADLLALTVQAVRPAVAHITLVPSGGELSPRYRQTYLEGVQLTESVAEPAHLPEAFQATVAGLPPEISEILVMTADLPFVASGWIASLFEGLAQDCDEVCVVEGERKVPLLGVCRRPALSATRMFAEEGSPAPDAAPPGPSRCFIQAAPLVGGGLTVASRLDSLETYRRALAFHGLCDPTQPAVTVELYGNLRIKTGCEQLPLHGDTVQDAFNVLRRVYPEAAQLLPEDDRLPDHFRFSINGDQVTTSLAHPLREGDHLVLFSATVGG